MMRVFKLTFTYKDDVKKEFFFPTNDVAEVYAAYNEALRSDFEFLLVDEDALNFIVPDAFGRVVGEFNYLNAIANSVERYCRRGTPFGAVRYRALDEVEALFEYYCSGGYDLPFEDFCERLRNGSFKFVENDGEGNFLARYALKDWNYGYEGAALRKYADCFDEEKVEEYFVDRTNGVYASQGYVYVW